MGQIAITLPDGSVREVEHGNSGRRGRGGAFRRVWRSLPSPAWSTAASSTCRIPLDADASVRIVTPESPEALDLYRHSTAHLMAAAVVNLFPGTQCGIGPATDEGYFYDFVVERPVRARGPRGDREEDAGVRLAGPEVRTPDDPQGGGEGLLRVARRTAQGAAHRREGRRRRVVLHDCRRLHGLLHRPARPVDGAPEGVQAAHDVQRLLEGRRAEPADAAGVRHRLLQRGRPEGVPAAHRGGEEARPPPARARARALHVPSRGPRARPSGSRRARRSTTSWPTTCGRCCSRPVTSS